jgi:hypothetical protein
MNRRTLIKRLTATVALCAVAPNIEAADAAGCVDCDRLFSATFTVPEMFDQQKAPGYFEMARKALHELAEREGISHDEAGLRVWGDAFPTYMAVPVETQGLHVTDRAAFTGGVMVTIEGESMVIPYYVTKNGPF